MITVTLFLHLQESLVWMESGGTALGEGGQGWGKGCDTWIQLLCAGKILPEMQ